MVKGLLYNHTQDSFWLALAYSAYFLNLFNMIPLTPLDGGRICAALSPWLWVPGLVILIGLMFQMKSFNPVMILILIAAVPKVIGLFRAKTDEEKRYYEVSPRDRFMVAASYFGLMALLLFQKEEAITALKEMRHWQH